MSIHKLFFAFVLFLTTASSAQAEIPPLSNSELQKSAHIYRGQVTKIEWTNRKSTGCISSVKEAKVHLRLNPTSRKQMAMVMIVKGHINVFSKDGCVGPSGNWGLEKLKVGDKVAVYGEKAEAGSLVEIRRPNGLLIQK